MIPPVLVATGLSKRFGGVHAVTDVSLELGPDAPVTTVIGPNGAGKTTLLNLLCGAISPDAGQVHFGGSDVTDTNMRRRMGMGIARTFQHTGIFGQLTARDHFTLMARNLGGHGRWHTIEDYLEAFHLGHLADVQAENLNHVSQRLLEIGMMVASGPTVLMLDEPTAGMDMHEIAQVRSVIRDLRGIVNIMIIEHDIDFVLSISDRVVVLDQGKIIAAGTPQEVENDDRVASAYMRREH